MSTRAVVEGVARRLRGHGLKVTVQDVPEDPTDPDPGVIQITVVSEYRKRWRRFRLGDFAGMHVPVAAILFDITDGFLQAFGVKYLGRRPVLEVELPLENQVAYLFSPDGTILVLAQESWPLEISRATSPEAEELVFKAHWWLDVESGSECLMFLAQHPIHKSVPGYPHGQNREA